MERGGSLFSNFPPAFFQGLFSDDDDESHLTPAEQRALRAEKRAAWRQARLKSLEQVRYRFDARAPTWP
jgi:hypothetical protein